MDSLGRAPHVLVCATRGRIPLVMFARPWKRGQILLNIRFRFEVLADDWSYRTAVRRFRRTGYSGARLIETHPAAGRRTMPPSGRPNRGRPLQPPCDTLTLAPARARP